MPDTPPSGLPPESDPAEASSTPPPEEPSPPESHTAPRKPPRWPMFIMLATTLIAVTAAIAAWLRPIPHTHNHTHTRPTASAHRIANAKSRVCAGYQKIHRALDGNSTRNSDDPNALQIYIAGSDYLLTVLADEPATPPDLTAAARKLARLFQILALEGLAAEPSVQAHKAADKTLSAVEGLCSK